MTLDVIPCSIWKLSTPHGLKACRTIFNSIMCYIISLSHCAGGMLSHSSWQILSVDWQAGFCLCISLLKSLHTISQTAWCLGLKKKEEEVINVLQWSSQSFCCAFAGVWDHCSVVRASFGQALPLRHTASHLTSILLYIVLVWWL